MSDPASTGLFGRFARLTVLNVLASLTVPLASLVDSAMLGFLPDVRFLAGVALASVIFDYAFWTFGFLRMSTTGLTAVAEGEGNTTEASAILLRGAGLGLLIGLLLVAACWPIAELGFFVLSGTPEVEAAGRDYYYARVGGAPVALANFAILGWLLGRGQSGRVLLLTSVQGLSNLAFNYIFIVLLDLRAFGAGLGTALSQALMFGVGVIMIWPQHERLRASLKAGGVFGGPAVKKVFSLNRDILIRTFCLITAFALFINVSATMGTVVLAANTLLQRLFTLVAYFIDGAALALEALAGTFFGQGRFDLLKRVARWALGFSILVAVLCGVPLWVWPETALGLLTDHLPVIRAAARFSPYLLPAMVFGSIAFALDGFFLGLTRGRVLRNGMLASFFIGFAPMAAWAFWTGSPDVLWWALVAFMAARAVTLAVPAWQVIRRGSA